MLRHSGIMRADALRIIDGGEFERIAVVGDIHGCYAQFLEILSKVDLQSECMVLLGDYADRGNMGIEVIEKVGDLIKKYPQSVVALKGNHESYDSSGEPNFSPCDLIREADYKRGGWKSYFRERFKPFVAGLYLAAILPGEALFVHGGVSSRITDINKLSIYEEDVLWSDPFDGLGERPDRRGAGVEFGRDVSEKVCKSLGVKRIIRSHEPKKAPNGPCMEHDGHIITTSCTTVYGGRPSVLFIETDSGKLYHEVL